MHRSVRKARKLAGTSKVKIQTISTHGTMLNRDNVVVLATKPEVGHRNILFNSIRPWNRAHSSGKQLPCGNLAR